MALIPYAKTHASVDQRIAHLRSKGLIVPRPSNAAKKIEIIGYERLRIYFLSRRQLAVPGRPFIPNTSCQDIIRLYECDSRIRDTCFAAVGQFEILFRNSLSEILSRSYGSHPYFNVAAFKDAACNLDAARTFADVYQRSKDRRAKHYRECYSEPIMPPIWTMKEFLTFGTASRLYQTLAGPLRTAIAGDFGIGKDAVFANWVECLVDIRNICAHHDRLFNRGLQKQPATLTSAALPTALRHKLKAILECLDYLLNRRGRRTGVTAQVRDIINRYPQVRLSEVGF